GLFFYTQKGSIISTVVLPTTEIIEPEIIEPNQRGFGLFFHSFFLKICEKNIFMQEKIQKI
ncbi:hypothetical protein ACJBQ0_09240, partial [Streptococcus suis]